jgi:hypothetical protein
LFSTKLHESTDDTNLTQFLVYIGQAENDYIKTEFLYLKVQKLRSEIFFQEQNNQQNRLCGDGSDSLFYDEKQILALVFDKVPNAMGTHTFLRFEINHATSHSSCTFCKIQ